MEFNDHYDIVLEARDRMEETKMKLERAKAVHEQAAQRFHKASHEFRQRIKEAPSILDSRTKAKL